jgi:RHS repeat-associated protein
MNGDGLVDRVVSDKSTETFIVWPNSGMGFSSAFWVWENPSAEDNHPQVIDVESQVTVADLVDLDGDQLPDRVTSESSGTPWQAYFSNTAPGGSFPLAGKPDLLIRIENGMGGSVTLTYASSAKYLDAAGNLLNPDLPSPVITLSSSTFDDGRGTAATTRYAYAEGRYDASSREFRGFGRVTVTGPAVPTSAGVERAVTETLFHQDDQLKAVPSRVTVFQDTDGDLSILRETSHAYHADPSAPFDRLLASIREVTFGAGQAARVRKTVIPSYLDGAPTEVQDLGEVLDEEDPFNDGTADERITQIAYADSQGTHRVGLPSHVTVTTGDPDDRQSERWFYYDGLPLGQALVGLQTKVEEWLYDPFDAFTLIVSQSFVHDVYGNITGSRDPNGRLTRTEYDDTYHTFPVVKVLPPLAAGMEGMIQSRTFDAALGVSLTETDLNGNVTRTSYDVLGRRDGTFFAPAGRPEFPLTQTLYHDALLGVVDDGETGSPSAQHLTHRRFTRAGGAEVLTTRVFFDGLGRPTRHESPGDQGRTTVVMKGYDPAGRLSTATVPFFAGEAAPLSRTEHDALGRPVRQTRPDGTTLLSTYDLWDRTDELLGPSLESLRMRTTRRDASGRVFALEEWNPLDPDGDPGPTSTLYAYDPRGNLAMVTDPQGNVTLFLYDTLDRKVAMADPNTGNWRYEYDLAGNLSRRTDARGVSVTYAYDALDRLLSRTSPEGTVTFEYDSKAIGPVPNGLGRLVRARSPSLIQDFHYDAFGNVEQINYMNVGRINSFLHTFDLLGREISTIYPDRELVTREYDGPHLTRVSSADAPGGRYLEDASYDAIGRPTHLTLGNGASITYQYDPVTTRLSAIQAASIAGPVLDLTYGYTPEGNIEAIGDQIDPARSQAFIYDSLGRILSAQGVYGSQSFRYDPIGNLVEKGGVTLDYAVGPGTTGGPQAVKSAGAQSFDYDANGNMTRMGALTLSYDAEGHLSTVREGGATLSARRYDAFGRRWRNDAGGTRWFFGDDFEWDGQSGTKTIFAGGRPIAARTAPYVGARASGCAALLDGDAPRSSAAGDLLPWAILILSLAAMRGLAGARRPVRAAARATGVGFLITAHLAATAPVARALPLGDDGSVRQGTLFYVLDHLGSTSLLMDEAGTVVREVSYDPWGAVASSDGSVDLERKFTGQRLDSRTGLYDYGARAYHPGIGRFIQPDAVVPDPASSQALNRYAYVTNNPLRYTDPTGRFPFLPILLGAAFGAFASHVQGGNPWVGALIGGISGGVGAGVSAAFGGGVAGGVAAGLVSGGTHAALRGSGTLHGALLGGLTGGLLAGVSGLNIRGFGLEDLVNPVYRELARVTNTAFTGLQMAAAYGRRALDALTFGRFTTAFNTFQNVWNYPNHAVADSMARNRNAIGAGSVNGAEVYAVDEVPLGAEAVTLGRRIFVPRNAEGLPVVLDPKILDHELGHVAAFNLLGPLTIPFGVALGLGASPIAIGVALSHPPDRFLANLREALYTYHPGEQLLINRGSRFPELLP